MRFFLLIVALAVLSGPVRAETIKITTWNIEHLRAENNRGNVRRDDGDFAALARYAAELDADVIALQEVDGPEAAARVFNPGEYDFFFSDRNNPQRTGFAVRKGLNVTRDEDFTDLALGDSLRRGKDITIQFGEQEVRFLNVHLKSFCFDNPLGSNNRNCRRLNQQVPFLETWIDERTAEGTPFVVLGDFNRRFDAPGDDFFPEIDDGDPRPLDLVRVNEGLTSECGGGRFPVFIDHLILDEQAAQFFEQDSFEQLVFTEEDEDEFRLSDHCPISASMNISGEGGPGPAERAEELFTEIRALVQEMNQRVDELDSLMPLLRQQQ